LNLEKIPTTAATTERQEKKSKVKRFSMRALNDKEPIFALMIASEKSSEEEEEYLEE